MRASSFSVFVLGLAGAVLVGCSGGGNVPECNDGVDNDRDGLIDDADPGCAAGETEAGDPTAACGDGADNDGDGLTDFPDDPGCTSAADADEYNARTPDCRDGADNDGDGKVDYPNDPGCFNPNQDGEDDDCPDGPGCPECGDGDDNDGDGQTDYPADPGCAAASGPTEVMLDPNACGAGTVIADLPANGQVAASIPAGTGHVASVSCNGRGAERAYTFTVDRPVTMVASTDSGGTFVDTVLYVRRTCLQAASELACSDNVSPTNNHSRLVVDLTPGTYYLVVDGRDLGSSGPFQLAVVFYEGLGQPCTGPANCAPGYTCRPIPPSTTSTCELPVCDDGRDDDGDGKTDYPDDPGCTTTSDASETDDCPAGPGCPACADGDDNDLDGLTDFPNDPSCVAASSPSEADCPIETDALIPVTPHYSGTTVGAHNDLVATCQSTFNPVAPDRVHLLDLKVTLASLTITTDADYDAVTSLLDSTCTATAQCEDFFPIERTNVPPGRYAIVLDGWSSDAGAYQLDVHGEIAVGGACNDPLVAAGVIACATGSACTGPAGMEHCTPAACNDTSDADGDGFPGYPTDPGCTSINDPDETDDCPSGPNCPQCGNHVDDDGDGATDYPMDFGCVAASGSNEECASVDPIIPFTANVVGASTAGHANDVDLACGTDGRDDVYKLHLTAPLAELRANTVGSAQDTVLAIKRGGCASFDLQCDDDSAGGGDAAVFLIDVAAGDYFLVVDDKGAGAPGTYNLTVTGLYADGAACDPLSTQFACTPGHACRGATPTCVPARCNDTVDDDGDGFPGFPTDPGCTSTSDDDETDTCPAGPGCPVCADDLDNDGDGMTDYPMDASCTSASADSEAASCISADPVVVFSQNLTGVTTAGHANDVALSCPFGDGADDIYRLFITQPLASLTVDTDGSAMETAIALRSGTCNGLTDLACGYFNSGVDDARASLSNVGVGELFVIVDDVGTDTPSTYNLHVTGVLPPGSTCNPLSTSFVCSAGYACAGATPTCVIAACNDTIDADGDGRPGYPTDPGCTSISDNTETDNCPSGPGCPACGNGLDDDGDGRIDYPMDLGCGAASGTTELECPTETDAIINVTTTFFVGSTAGAANNFTASCGSTFMPAAPDRVHFLNLRVPVATLTLDTENSSFDTTLTLTDSTCGTEIECDDDDGVTGNNSFISRTAVPAGVYAIIVDGYATGFGTYNLNVRGTIGSGSSCNDPLVAAGVLTCTPGTTCQAGVCSP